MINDPLSEAEKGTGAVDPQAFHQFFQPRQATRTGADTHMEAPDPNMEEETTLDFCKGVTDKVNDASFSLKHQNATTPIAMIAFAKLVQEEVLPKKKHHPFNGLTITVPPSKQGNA